MNTNPSPSDSRPLKAFLQRWVITTVAVLVAANVVPGITYDSFPSVVVASLVLGVLNAFVRPFILVLSLPLLLATLGVFLLIINAALLYFVGSVVKSFHVATFGAAMWGAFVISLVSVIANGLFGAHRASLRVERGGPRRPTPGGPPAGSGPVIDV